MLVKWTRAQEERIKQLVHQQGVNMVLERPPVGWIKFNTDVMCQQQDGRLGVGCVIRDNMGIFVRARSKVIQGYGQPREVEAIGLQEALSWRSVAGPIEADKPLIIKHSKKFVTTLDMGLLVAGTKYRGELEERLKKLLEEKKHIEKDPALERPFQPVKVPEPSVDETIQILKGLRERYEIHHKFRYTDEALVSAAQLSYQYIRTSALCS
ncbi:hypothetical protein AgCh_007859 [Apium graveolens]